MIRLLHTSDWHIGQVLHSKKRYEEFESFLNWLAETIQKDAIDVLLVAGDIFDTSTPSNRAQELYYSFLRRVAVSCCRHIVITAGNHDSPSFLDAPKELLKALQIHVIGSVSEDVEREVLVLCDIQNKPELIVCAVPYLRDRDIRLAEAGESAEDKEQKLVDGIRKHYAAVAALAEEKRKELKVDIPIVAMGHMFVAGGQTLDGDGVRKLYIGSLAHVAADIFSDCINYVALGHLHSPQKVIGKETIRYSGSPLPMGFGDAKQQKSVCQVTFQHTTVSVQLIDVPVFQKLERIQGNWESIARRISELSATSFNGWLEVTYDGEEIIGNLRERLDIASSDTQMEIICVKNNRIINHVLERMNDDEALSDLDETEVFKRCLDAHNVPDEQRLELLRTYQETLSSMHEDDSRAE